MAPTLSRAPPFPAQPPAPANVLYSTPIIKRVLYNGTIGILPYPFPFAPEASKRGSEGDSGEGEPIKGALIIATILTLIGVVLALVILYLRGKFPPPVTAMAGQRVNQIAGDNRSSTGTRDSYSGPSPASYVMPSSPLHPNHHLRPLVMNLAIPANVHMPATQAGPGSRPAAAPRTTLLPVLGDEDDMELFAIDSPTTVDGDDHAGEYHQAAVPEDDNEQQNGAVKARNLTHNL
ncbi:hypothetical protein N3K66_006431 [Trichothecium roseum]|uniref:Uncharacterized protein n=1 Tax=Trichothecium roseum TaxID=47278 RepID=A0ACC0UVC7_9HYPO|nr:hypothetical protein N3K66_006431 [Trichothecium roseum]